MQRLRNCVLRWMLKAITSATGRCAGSPRGIASRATKKTAHGAEQERPDVLSRRKGWFQAQEGLAPDRLVIIDESWASTNMTHRSGRSRRGERQRVSVPHGHWKTTMVIAGLCDSGIVATFVIDCPVNRAAF